MSKSVKDMLKDGALPSDLVKDLNRQINEAIVELEEENRKSAVKEEEDLDFLRGKAVSVTLDYLVKLGVLDDGVDSTLLDSAIEMVKSIEPELKKYAKILDILLDKEEKAPKKEYKPITLTRYNNSNDFLDAKLAELMKDIIK